jgi:PGF-CTERM protein
MRGDTIRGVGLVVLMVLSVVALATPASAVGPGDAAGAQSSTTIDSCTVIDESGTYVLTEDISAHGTCIEITASDVTLDGQGHTIENDNQSAAVRNVAIHANGTDGRLSNVTVTDVTLEAWAWNGFGNVGRAVIIEDVDDGNVSHAQINGSDRGIELVNASDSTVAHNDLWMAGKNTAIYLQENSGGNRVADNNITATADKTDQGGIDLSNSNNNTVVGNDVFGDGVDLSSGSGYNNITDNTLHPDWLSHGIRLGFSGHNNITGNEVLGAGRHGIRLDHGGEGNFVADNLVNGSDGKGISVYRVQNTTIRNNTVSGTGDHGIQVHIATNVTVRNNVVGDSRGIISNPGYAINLNDGDDSTIDNNTLYLSGGGGIRLKGSFGEQSERNEVTNNSIRSLNVSDDPLNNYLDAPPILISTAANPAIELNGAEDNAVVGNSIRNGWKGIAVNGSSNSTLVDNGVYDPPNNTLGNYSRWSLIVVNSSNTTVERLDIGNSTKTNTTVSLTGRNYTIDHTLSPPANPDANGVGRYVNATNLSSDARLNLSIHYVYADVETINQSSFAVWSYDAGGWHEHDDSTLDTDAQSVGTSLNDSELNDSSVHGAFGQNGTWPTPTPTETESAGTDTVTEGADTPTETAAAAAQGTTETGQSTTTASGPGFGAVAGLLAVVLAGLLVGRRE